MRFVERRDVNRLRYGGNAYSGDVEDSKCALSEEQLNNARAGRRRLLLQRCESNEIIKTGSARLLTCCPKIRLLSLALSSASRRGRVPAGRAEATRV